MASSDENSISTDANLSATRVGQRAMYRLYNKWSGEHFYTCDETERDGLVKIGWTNESIGWVAPKTSSTPVYRLYNKYVVGGDHHYTISASERDSLKKAGWTYEGVGWYSVDEGTLYRTPAYRQYNPNQYSCNHNYTIDVKEKNTLIKAGWNDEGISFYGLDHTKMSAVNFDKDIKVTTTSKVYNGKAQTITSTNMKQGRDFVVEYSNNVNVGTATITITGTNGYYGEKKYTFKITQKPVTVKWSATEFAYTGKAQAPTATAVGLCGTDKASVTVVASGNHKNTGTYTATATAISNKNYKLSGTLKTNFRIGAQIDFTNKNKVTINTNDEIYTSKQITKSVSLAGLTQGKDYQVTYKNNINVGTATATIKGIGSYFGQKSYTFKITQRSIAGATVTLDSKLTYNAKQQTQKVSKVTVKVNGADLQVPLSSCAITNNTGKEAKDYTLTVKASGNFKDSVTPTFSIAKLDVSKAEVTLGDSLTYTSESQTQKVSKVTVGGVELTEGVDFDVSGNTATPAGTYDTMTIEGTGNCTGTKDNVKFEIKKAPITVSWTAKSFTYDGGLHKPIATFTGTQGTDSVTLSVSGAQTNANADGEKYKATAEIDETSQANYEVTFDTKTVEFTIAKADPVYKPTGLKGGWGKALSTVTLREPTSSETPAESIVWDNASTVMNDKGEQKYKVTFIPKDTANYNVYTFEFTVDVMGVKATFNATAPAGYTISLGSTYTSETTAIEQKLDFDDPTATTPVHTFKSADFPKVKIVTSPNSDNYYFAGWATTSGATTGTKVYDMFDTTISADTEYYAVWATADGFWLGTAGADETYIDQDYFKNNDPNYLSGADIVRETDILHDSDDSEYKTIKEKWDKYYTDDVVRLYTTYSGGEAVTTSDNKTSALNKYVEFRILEVSGADGHPFATAGAGNDESAVTFMATHLLPTRSQMKTGDTNSGGWGNAYLKSSLNDDSVAAGFSVKFPSDFKGALREVTKEYNKGAKSDRAADPEKTKSKMWVISYSELVSATATDYLDIMPTKEGTQYAWCVNNVTKGNGANNALAYRTRSGQYPKDLSYAAWWLRSPRTDNVWDTDNVSCSNGNLNVASNGDGSSNNYFGVVPSFCF